MAKKLKIHYTSVAHDVKFCECHMTHHIVDSQVAVDVSERTELEKTLLDERYFLSTLDLLIHN